MARPRKNSPKPNTQELALVPVEEQPYPLPESWKWVRLVSLCTLRNGKAFKPSDWSDEGLPIVRIQNLNTPESKFNYYNGPVDDKFLLQAGDLLFAWSGTPGTSFGAHIWYGGKAVLNQHIFRMDFEEKNILKSFFRYAINHRLEELIAKAHGGAGLQHVTKGVFENTPIPLPPLDEQERIVTRIESLFAKLDEAKEKAETVLDSYEARKAAILHKAFTGELTAKWREERGVPKSDWKSVPFCQVAEVKSNLVDPADFQDLPHIAPDNIEKKTGRLLEYRTIAEDKVTSGKHRFYPGQILYSKIRPYLSKVVVIDFDGLCSADMYPIEAKEDTKYLWYYMLSEDFLEQASSAGSRSVLPKINQKELSRITIHRPNLPEQQEITRILDSLLEKEQQSKEAAETVLEQIDLMKKAILAKAFRGELGKGTL